MWDSARIEKRLQTGYIDRMTDSLSEAVEWALAAKEAGENTSIGVVADIGDLLEYLLQKGITPEILTDQTSAHDPINGYIPNGETLASAAALRKSDPQAYRQKAVKSMARHVNFMLALKARGSVTFDYGNNLRAFAQEGGAENAFGFKGFTPEYIRPLFCERQRAFSGGWPCLATRTIFTKPTGH